MKKLNQAIDRFCILHPNFGIPNLMLYVVIGNVVLGLLSNFSNGNFLSFFSYTLGSSPWAGLAARHLCPHP